MLGKRISKVVIVFLNYNGVKIKFGGKSILKQSLDSLENTAYKNYKIVAINNGSTDTSKSELKRRNIETINIKKNIYNFSRISNIGIRYAIKKYNPDYVMIYSNDVFVKDPNWLTEIVRVADTENDAGIVACKIIYPDGRLQSLGSLFIDGECVGITQSTEKRYHSSIEADMMPGCAFLIRKEAITKVGMLDENFVMAYEDLDYSLRMKRAGFKVLITDKTSIIHLSGFTNASLQRMSINAQKIMTYKNMRSYLYFFDKNRNLLTAKERFSRAIKRFPLLFFGFTFTKMIPASEKHIFGIKKYASLWNLWVASKAIIDHNIDKMFNRDKKFEYYKKIRW